MPIPMTPSLGYNDAWGQNEGCKRPGTWRTLTVAAEGSNGSHTNDDVLLEHSPLVSKSAT